MDQALIGPAAFDLRPAPRLFSNTATLAIIAVVALLTRIVTFGNPMVVFDDQFYLLVGEAMWDGQWPYIDVWDRKPPGLFVLFAMIAAVGGGSILAMQLIATIFAAATAFIIHRLARFFAGEQASLLAALAYLVMLPLFGGQSGQSPVFYNLFIAGSALLLLTAATRAGAPIFAYALASMLLCGLAMSIKQVTVAEGAACGLAFLWLLWKENRGLPRLALKAAAMIAVALLPVALPFLVYALRGTDALDAFVYANYVSIFDKENFGIKAKLAGFGFLLLYSCPLIALAGLGIRRLWRERRASAPAFFIVGWVFAAILGYLAVPLFFDHYALPLLVPLCVAAGIAFDRAGGRLYFAGLLVFCLIQGSILDLGGNRRARATFDAVSQRINEARHGGCVYLADGPAWLYQTTGQCRLTSYLFPEHLHLLTERKAIGADPRAEVARILARRPAVIVTQDTQKRRHNPRTEQLLLAALSAEYRPIYRIPHDGGLLETLRVWQRRDLPPPKARL